MARSLLSNLVHPPHTRASNGSLFIRHTPGHGHEHRPEEFARVMYDHVKKMGRRDGFLEFKDEVYFGKRVWNHVEDKEYHVFYRQGFETCYVRALNTTMPFPTFNNVKYIGESVVDGHLCYSWIEEDPKERRTLLYYDRQDDRSPKRIEVDFGRGVAETWDFHEFDACPQDKELYEIGW
eukprot:CAMPEP_0168538974 /NCGR_PEP_ID=MMETSP0405-20121227/21529_1 /TAXON_ID=498012 /ORGANISM="Trichosphaerium sp, Strain Am-I-7 wt" /LENGTH=178 /DNA_ID=CAMNT_0008568403 /DNA_START=85 /DNA_END=618 /DNA_ORIENTATION=-